MASAANKSSGFMQFWLVWNNVENDTETQIIDMGVDLHESLSADVSANFKHRDSEHILLAQVAGYNKVCQIIW